MNFISDLVTYWNVCTKLLGVPELFNNDFNKCLPFG
uniref:Uncharacterized protein n=1 Tax=Anguilla anguilla TaxID=7936 RepID=A0A0E9TEE3_ANGAN